MTIKMRNIFAIEAIYPIIMIGRNYMLKNTFKILLFIFIFILNMYFCPGNAQYLEFSSVSFDNSGSLITLNSKDNLDYPFDSAVKLSVDEDKKEAYFDIQPARINADKSYVVDSNEIEEISITQISTNPDIVRTVINYKENFNPKDIAIKRLHNTVFINLKKTVISNYYFQDVYKESPITQVDEKINIQQKIQTQKNILGEINSAFTNSSPSENENYVLSQKNLILKTKYYVNSVTIKGDIPILNGNGAYTISKPIYLSNPNRVAYDIKNTVVNPLLRNKDIQFGEDTIKIGQFNHNTARVVISSEKPEAYTPIIYGDSSKLGFLNTIKSSPLNLYTYKSNMTSVLKEKNDNYNYCAKFAFSKPIIFGLSRTSDKLEIFIHNLNNYFSGAINTELRNTPLEDLKISDIKTGGAKLSVPIKDKNNIYDVFVGADGKTLRIKLKTATQYIPKEDTKDEIIIVPQSTQNRSENKRYVVIDAGHGGSDYGAIRNGINEKDITLDIAQKVKKQLENKGYTVAMTRTDDTYVSLQDRVEFSEIFNPDIFVSIHVNSSNSDAPHGIETHYYKDNSLKLAKYVHASMLNNINSKDRGLFKSKFYVINHTTAPAILVEMGFISNPTERSQLTTESRKNATAKAIVEGIDDYFKQ